jgi:hypothetical protein
MMAISFVEESYGCLGEDSNSPAASSLSESEIAQRLQTSLGLGA